MTLGEDIVTLAATDSIVFIANVIQTDLSRIRPGARVAVSLSAVHQRFAASLHSILPLGASKDLTTPVRIDFAAGQSPRSLGLYGEALIVVDQRLQALVVPPAAVLRDDISGQARLATVTPANKVHWVEVQTGVETGEWVELLSPALAVGEQVILTGQVGLPEGSLVQGEP